MPPAPPCPRPGPADRAGGPGVPRPAAHACRRCGRSPAPSPAPRCSRSTRSTCCSGPTTCRCSPGWAPTTPTCCAGPPSGRRGGWWSTGRTSRPSCRSSCGRTCGTGCGRYRGRGARVAAFRRQAGAGRLAGRRDRRAGRRRRRATSTTGCRASKEHWGWNWSETKKALEYLFLAGELAVAGRNSAFERLYDLPERVIPRRACSTRRSRPTRRRTVELLRRAAAPHGVGTEC